MTLGEKLKWVRQQRGWLQRELARRAGVGAARLSHLECGRTHDPRGPTLRTLARTLGVSMDYLTSPSALTPQHSAALYHPGTTIPAQQFARLKALIVAMDET